MAGMHKHAICDGGIEFGHPRVFLEYHEGKAVCPYCSKQFVAKGVSHQTESNGGDNHAEA